MSHTIAQPNTTETQYNNCCQEVKHSHTDHGQVNHVSYKARFDIWEADDRLILYGDIPGVNQNDLEVLYENRQLTIHGRVAPKRTGNTYLYREYGVGDFHRTFTIGEAIDSDAITADLRDGVLTVSLPKVNHAKSRRIEVNAN